VIGFRGERVIGRGENPQSAATPLVKQPFPINEARIRVILNHKNFTKRSTWCEVIRFSRLLMLHGRRETLRLGFSSVVSAEPSYETDDANPIPFVRMEGTVAAHIRVEYRLDPS